MAVSFDKFVESLNFGLISSQNSTDSEKDLQASTL